MKKVCILLFLLTLTYRDTQFGKRKVYQTYILIVFSWWTLTFTLRKTVFSQKHIWQTILERQKSVSK